MRLKVSYERPDRTVEDVQLSAELSCPVGSIAEELICSDPRTLAGRECAGQSRSQWLHRKPKPLKS